MVALNGGSTGKEEPKKDDKKEEKKDPPKLELDPAKDKVERGDKTSGLGRVMVHRTSATLASDVAAAVKAKVAGRPVRIVEDLGALRGADLLALLLHRLDGLETSLDAVVPERDEAPAPPPKKPAKKAPAKKSAGPRLATVAPISVAAGALQVAGIVSKLFAHDYQLSGREVPVDNLGFDLQVAHHLAAAGVTNIRVDRLLPSTIAATDVVRRVAAIERRARTDLAKKIAEAAADEATAAAGATADANEHAQVVELIKRLDSAAAAKELDKLRAERKALRDRSDDEGPGHDALVALAEEIATFVNEVVTPPSGGGRAPLIEAARAEVLAARANPELLLYVRVTAGGMDEIVDSRPFLADSWTTVAGVAAEYAVVDAGNITVSGAVSTVRRREAKLSRFRWWWQAKPPGLED
ncbi:MAG TPA: hypothetical protein VNQ77_15680 [Frankiaceae bacterium]|nr:hypothetical protein [Frankiaceae bacterium]